MTAPSSYAGSGPRRYLVSPGSRRSAKRSTTNAMQRGGAASHR
jgi:hypothetical protein